MSKNRKYSKDRKEEARNAGRTYSKGPRHGKKSKDDKEDRRDAISKTLDKHEEYNNITHYIRDPQILEQASQLSFQNFIGATPIDKYDVPSIMRFFMNPTPGLTYQKAIPSIVHPKRAGVNSAAIKLFNLLSMSSGRNMAYGPQDVGTMLLALGQLYAMFSYLRRLFGSVNVWNTYNRMYPRAIIEAMGIDYDDFTENYSDYRTRVNAIITILNQVPLLMNCGYLEKSMTQYEFIFTDTESPLAQSYIYLPRTTWLLDETSYSGGTILSTLSVVPTSGTRTLSDLLINVIRPMVDAFVTSSTFNLVYADLLNLAQKGAGFKFITIPYIVEGVATIPQHNYEALLHIHNMTVLGVEPSVPTFNDPITPFNDVYPDASENMLIYNPGYLRTTQVPTLSEKVTEHMVVDSPVAMPDAATRIEMTRYKATFTNNYATVGGIDYLTYVIVPDYVCVLSDIICSNVSSPIGMKTIYNSGAYSLIVYQLAPVLSQFDWHPIIETYDWTNEDIENVHGDLNYYTQISRAYLEKLNVVIFLGLFELQ